jgi:peroxiredoxin
MKKINLTFIFFLTFSVFSLGQTNQTGKKEQVSKNSALNEQNIIIQLEKDFYKAKLENNVKFMDEILSNDCISTNQYGGVKNKSAFLTLWKTFKTRTFTLDSVHVKLVNDTTAIASGWQTENGAQMSFTHHLIKQKGKWQILSMVQKFPQFQSMQGMGSYRIMGYLKGAEGVAISLMRRGGGNMNAAIVKDGKFTMEGKAIEYPDMVFLTTPGQRESASFFLENSEITITGSLDSLSKVKVTGSKTQDEYYAFLSKLETIRNKTRTILQDARTAEQNNDTSGMAKIRTEMEDIRKQQTAAEKEFVRNNPASYAVPVVLNNLYSKLSTEENESIIKSLDPGVAKTQTILLIIENVRTLKTVEIGQKAPEFVLKDVNGNSVSLSSRIGSRLLLIDFWAAWCVPCRRENPNLLKVYNDFKDKGFEVLGVSLDRAKEDWIKAIEKDQLPWMQVSDLLYWDSPVAQLYAVKSIPANFLLDKSGIIIAKNLRGDDLINKVKEMLKE